MNHQTHHQYLHHQQNTHQHQAPTFQNIHARVMMAPPPPPQSHTSLKRSPRSPVRRKDSSGSLYTMATCSTTASSIHSSSHSIYHSPLKKVSFGEARIREHKITLGDNPACRDGLPVCLDWRFVDGHRVNLSGSVGADYDGSPKGRCRRAPKELRKQWLQKEGFHEVALLELEQELDNMRLAARLQAEAAAASGLEDGSEDSSCSDHSEQDILDGLGYDDDDDWIIHECPPAAASSASLSSSTAYDEYMLMANASNRVRKSKGSNAITKAECGVVDDYQQMLQQGTRKVSSKRPSKDPRRRRNSISSDSTSGNINPPKPVRRHHSMDLVTTKPVPPVESPSTFRRKTRFTFWKK